MARATAPGLQLPCQPRHIPAGDTESQGGTCWGAPSCSIPGGQQLVLGCCGVLPPGADVCSAKLVFVCLFFASSQIAPLRADGWHRAGRGAGSRGSKARLENPGWEEQNIWMADCKTPLQRRAQAHGSRPPSGCLQEVWLSVFFRQQQLWPQEEGTCARGRPRAGATWHPLKLELLQGLIPRVAGSGASRPFWGYSSLIWPPEGDQAPRSGQGGSRPLGRCQMGAAPWVPAPGLPLAKA